MWYRWFLAGIALVAWAGVVWLATHRSETPDVFGRFSVSYFLLLATVAIFALAASITQFRPLYTRLYPGRKHIVLLLAAVTFSLGAAELLVRATDLMGVSYYPETVRYYLRYKIPDNDLIYRHRAGMHEDLQGVLVTTNELGLRERPIPPKGGDEFRVVMLGDSVTFGWGVAVEDTFPRKLEALLAEQRPGPVHVINTGVGSYNTEQELIFLTKHGDRLKPDLVVLLYIENDDNVYKMPFDVWGEYTLQGKSPPQVFRIMLSKSWFYQLIKHSVQYGKTTEQATAERDSPGWRRSMAALAKIGQYCRARDVPCVTFLYRLSPSARTDALLEDISAVARIGQFPVEDTMPWFEGIAPKSIVNSIVDAHPNAAGHAILAKGMFRQIMRSGYLEKKSVSLNRRHPSPGLNDSSKR